jgi:hypothetical protein
MTLRILKNDDINSTFDVQNQHNTPEDAQWLTVRKSHVTLWPYSFDRASIHMLNLTDFVTEFCSKLISIMTF